MMRSVVFGSAHALVKHTPLVLDPMPNGLHSYPLIDPHRPGGTRCWAKGGVDSCRRPDGEGPAFDWHDKNVSQPVEPITSAYAPPNRHNGPTASSVGVDASVVVVLLSFLLSAVEDGVVDVAMPSTFPYFLSGALLVATAH